MSYMLCLPEYNPKGKQLTEIAAGNIIPISGKIYRTKLQKIMQSLVYFSNSFVFLQNKNHMINNILLDLLKIPQNIIILIMYKSLS